MQKPKKYLKNLARMSAYLKKEGNRIEKIISRSSDVEGTPLSDGVMRRLSSRREVALVDLGLIDAAIEAALQARRSAQAEKKSSKKADKKKPANKKPAKKKSVKKKPTRKVAQSPLKATPKSGRKAAPKKAAPTRRRRAKVAAPAEA